MMYLGQCSSSKTLTLFLYFFVCTEENLTHRCWLRFLVRTNLKLSSGTDASLHAGTDKMKVKREIQTFL